MSGPVLSCGFLPLVDAAPLVIAREIGFAQEEGVELTLIREPSWSPSATAQKPRVTARKVSQLAFAQRATPKSSLPIQRLMP